jgi:UDP-N-acetylmuramoylalanine--D-glutamate ligase
MQSDLHGTVGILGFGVDGQSVCEWLSQQSDVGKIVVFDDQVTDNTKIRKYENTKIGLSLDGVSLLFRSPGFPLTHPLIKEAKKRGVPVTSSTIEVLKGFSGTTVGVTGSNGKTTCVALIEEFLKAEFGEDRVERGGNDGVPRLDLIRHAEEAPSTLFETHDAEHRAPQGDVEGAVSKHLVLELSSFQLIDCPVSPNVAVILNITPNHLDWHRDMEEYAEAKRQIVAHQKKGDHAILNQNDPIVKAFAGNIASEAHWFPYTDYRIPNSDIRCKTHPDTLQAAIVAARAMKVSEANVLKVLRIFPGVPHRLEFIRELDGISYYNDSSCTTPESAIVACEAFPKGSLALLLGGRDKGMDFSRLYALIRERDVTVVPYGEMAETFTHALDTKYQIPNTEYQSFESTIDTARSTGRKYIVLSPACASFDMFGNAKERGKAFAKIVYAL